MSCRADFRFYREVYGGTALEEEAFREAVARAADVLLDYARAYQLTGTDHAEAMALCAMAEVIAYFDAAQNGQGGLRYAKVGSVSVSGKGIYSQVDISPQAQEKELYRTACRYLAIYRGVRDTGPSAPG